MATEVLNTRFQFKRGLAEAWERNNPILAAGEPGWTLDTHVLKIGDGKTCWLELEGISGVNVDPAKDTYTKKEIDELIVNAKTSLIGLIQLEEQRAKQAEEANAKTLADILNENSGVLAQAKAYTDGALAAVAMLKVDDNTIKIKDEKAYVAKVSTDVLEQGERNLILCAGSSNI